MGVDSLERNGEGQGHDRSAFARSFERAVWRARVFGLLERAWARAAMPAGGTAGLFLTASWMGLWTVATPSLRMAGVALFAAALTAAARPLLGLRLPTRSEAIDRLDAKTGIPHRPAATYDSIPVAGSSPEAAGLYEAQRRRIESRVGAFTAGAPQSDLVYRDPYALRLCLLIATIMSGAVAYSEGALLSRPAAAFDWRAETMARPPVKMDAWVTAPGYTAFAPVYIASAKDSSAHKPAQDFVVPQNSVLTLRIHDEHTSVSSAGGTELAQTACRERGEIRECSFSFSGDATVTVHTLRDGDLVWSFGINADRPPQVVASADPSENRSGIDYRVTDEYAGADVSRGVIHAPPPAGDTGARTLPHYALPEIVISRP